ncbi:MAG TPA: sugar transferase [Candidatus Kapabacteria bacterium]|nr:sugar transferase [Candidatus Kapabacteria bacterium]
MLRRQKQIRVQVQKLLDGSLFAVALWLAHYIRSTVLKVEIFGGTADIEDFSHWVRFFLIIIPVAPLLLETQGFYTRPLVAGRRVTLWQLVRASFLAVVVLVTCLFLFKEPLARSVIFLFGPISVVLVGLKEELMRRWIKSRLGKTQMVKRLILVGSDEDCGRVAQELQHNDSVEIVAKLNLNESSVEKLVDLLHVHSANGVLLSAKHTFFGQIEKAIQACELEGVEAWLLADFFNTQVSQTTFDDLNGRPMLVFRSTPEDSWQKVAKHALDVFGALAFLLVTFIPFLLIALAIKLTSPGPIFFQQRRSGLNGNPFTMLKFRSMVTNAEQRKAELEIINEMDGPVFKVTNDPRITPIGRVLRRWSVDEWPQMFNVLMGDMSLVGPRPLPVDEVRRFDDLAHRRRLSVKPGLTCLWQVNGRNTVTSFREWVRLDLEYIDNWSIWLDLKILLKTVPVVILGTGAK